MANLKEFLDGSSESIIRELKKEEFDTHDAIFKVEQQTNLQKQVSYLGYSERGVFNSIIYYLLSHPDFMPEFLKSIGITDEICLSSSSTFSILGEQSFSDFGDSDMVIIAENQQKNSETVIFIEGKIKTIQGNFSLEQHFSKLKNCNTKFKGISSNIFVQLYYKYLLFKILQKNENEKSIMFLRRTMIIHEQSEIMKLSSKQ